MFDLKKLYKSYFGNMFLNYKAFKTHKHQSKLKVRLERSAFCTQTVRTDM